MMNLLKLAAMFLAGLLVSCREQNTQSPGPVPQTFFVRGTVREIKQDGRTAVIRHDEITNYMPAMTMPFHARGTNELAGVRAGDEITFRLSVAENESWIDRVDRIGHSNTEMPQAAVVTATNAPQEFHLSDIPDFALTNEFGQPVSLRGFQGRAVALTFFFTRCPIPEYCPRLTKNFQGAITKLKEMPAGPTNFHFLSISFDPFDAPPMLRSYGRQHRYDSNHWSFITGDKEQIRELALGFGVNVTPDGASFNHGFRTSIFDTTGRLQNSWPIGGDMTGQIVAELVRAARAGQTNN